MLKTNNNKEYAVIRKTYRTITIVDMMQEKKTNKMYDHQ